jgi:hypothetical protein
MFSQVFYIFLISVLSLALAQRNNFHSAEIISSLDAHGNDELKEWLNYETGNSKQYDHLQITIHKGTKPIFYLADNGGAIIENIDISEYTSKQMDELMVKHEVPLTVHESGIGNKHRKALEFKNQL